MAVFIPLGRLLRDRYGGCSFDAGLVERRRFVREAKHDAHLQIEPGREPSSIYSRGKVFLGRFCGIALADDRCIS